MQDEPCADEILAAVAAQLRAPRADAEREAFQARVAASAIDLVRRHLDLAPAEEAAELKRLRDLIGRDDTLEALNAELAEQLAEGRADLDTPGVRAHLRATTHAKLAVDQPGYATYRAAIGKP